LEQLTSLQSLDLRCEQLISDLSSLTRLTSLQSLDLAGCKHLSGDLSPLAGLTPHNTASTLSAIYDSCSVI
jgi:hypothetical protein